MPTCCSMSCCWAVGRQKDVRVIGNSLVSSSTVLSSTSKSPVVSASSSAKLAESQRNVIFKAIAQTARWEARRLCLQHYQNYLYSHHWEIEIYPHMRNIFFITGKFLGFVKKLSEKKWEILECFGKSPKSPGWIEQAQVCEHTPASRCHVLQVAA